MHKQPDLFRPMCAELLGVRQPELFPEAPDSDLACACGELLCRTPSGYLACPRGHGRLTCETTLESPERSGLCFPDEE